AAVGLDVLTPPAPTANRHGVAVGVGGPPGGVRRYTEAASERDAADAEARGGRLPSGHVDRLRRPAGHGAVARHPAEGDGVAAGREPIERNAACSANGLPAAAGHTDRVAARLVRARGVRADCEAAGERDAADGEARGSRLAC